MTEKGKGKRGEKEAHGMITESGIHLNRSRVSNEAGQVLILVALAIFVLIGSVALAVDVGFLRYMKRNMQKAADAGAIGGATEHIYDVGNVVIGARRDTSQNGFTHDENGVIVTVNNPPLSGPHKDLADAGHYVEVIIEQDQPTFFAKIFNITSAKVIARAVAYGGTDSEKQALGCIYTLDPTGSSSFHVSGENTLVEADCAIYVNSNSEDCASRISGNSTVHSTGISVVGESCIGGSGTEVEPDPETGATPVSDPLTHLNEPTGFPTSCPPNRTDVDINTDTTLTPGVYCGGIKVTNPNLTINFDPGLYILYGGGIDMHSSGTLLGRGVTFYNTGSGTGGKTGYGSININAGAGTELFATGRLATSGEGTPPSIPGILIWQDPNNEKDATFNGQSDTRLEGALYFPSADITFNGGNSTATGYAVLVAQNVKFTGSATFTITNESSGSGGDPGDDAVIPRVVLVE